MSARVAKDKQAGGEREVYPTPAWVIDRLLDELGTDLDFGAAWLEPSAGDGAIIEAVNRWRARGLEDAISRSDVDALGHYKKIIQWTANEIRPECAAPLGALVGQQGVVISDFLTETAGLRLHLQERNGAPDPFDVTIGNPPFSLAREFITAARSISRVTIMLARIALLESADRAEWMRADGLPSAIFVLPDRPQFVNGASDNAAYAWMVWTQAPLRGTDGRPTAQLRVLETTPYEIRKPGGRHARRKTVAATATAAT